MKTDTSEETTVVAVYAARHDAEIAKSFLVDHGIDSFVVADDVHVPLQLTEGARLVVMKSQAQSAYNTLSAGNLLPDSIATDAYLGDDEGENENPTPSDSLKETRASKANPKQKAVIATTVATLVILLLFFIPWRIDRTEEIVWAPIYRSPISHATTFQELGSARMNYETGEVAFSVLFLQVIGVITVGWLASVVVGVVGQGNIVDEE